MQVWEYRLKYFSDIYLKIEIIKKTGYFITLILFLFFSDSPQILALSLLICTVIQVVVNSIPNRKLIDYKGSQQLRDLSMNLIASVMMFLAVKLVGCIHIAKPFVLCIQVPAGMLMYLLIAYVTKNRAFAFLLNTLKNGVSRF